MGVLLKLVALSVFFGSIVKIIGNEQYKVVDTVNGRVRGILKTTLINQTEYYSFKGIRYAKNPIGNLRFKVSLC